MGYCYTKNRELVCDACNSAGGVKKRRCPHKVFHTDHRTGHRVGLNYCPAPALCDACFEKYGKNKGVHGGCKAKAAASQQRQDAEDARLDAGDHRVNGRSGDWHDAVPKGMVGACYRGKAEGDVQYVLVDKQYANVEWLEDLPAGSAIPWDQTAVVEKGVQVA